MNKIGEKLKHIIIPMVTPFNRMNQDISYENAEHIADYLVSRGYCDSLLVAGTTGEFNTLSFEEKVQLFKAVKNAVGGRVPLIAGTGAASTQEVIKLTLEAEKIGYDVVMVVAPYYCKPSQEGIYMHYKAIAENTNMPVLLYNIPIFTGVNINPSTLAKLSVIKNIVGIKDEAGINPTQMTEYAHVTGSNFSVYNGDDIMVLCGLAQGASGVVSGGSHLVGDKMRKMIELFNSGNNEEAREIHMQLDPFFKALCPNGRVNPIPVLKAALEMAGLPAGICRSPLDEPTQEEKEGIKKHLVRLQLL